MSESEFNPPLKKQKLNEPEENSNAKEDERKKGLAEEELVGMKHYLGSSECGFNGVLKLRFEDFLVHEVDTDGNVVHLTDTQPLQAAEVELPDPKVTIAAVLSPEEAESFWKFVNETSEEDKAKASFTLSKMEDKDSRTAVHKALKSVAGVRSVTENGCIVVEFEQKRIKGRIRDDWNSSGPQFVHFVLEKHNVDTTKCISDISRKMQYKSGRIGCAGTKDRRGITVQKMSGFRLDTVRLVKVVSGLNGVKVGNFKEASGALRLGDLSGNRFSIVIREVEGEESNINESLKHTQEHGFINYYGMQRFGTGKIPSHHVGIAILQNEWTRVIDLLLSPDNRLDTRKGLTHLQTTKNLTEAAGMLPRGSIELRLVQYLIKHGENTQWNAFTSLPRNLRLLYVHAFQSFVWNEVASQRLIRFGRDIIEGDLILLSEIREEPADDESLDDIHVRCSQSVRPVTKAEIESKRFTIFDVVLPLPGVDVTYPTFMKDLYSELFQQNGLQLSQLDHKYRDYTLSGSYRKILQKPDNLEWEILNYDNLEIPLFQSDSDIINKVPPPVIVNEGKHTAVKLSFTLQSSVYATMFLREVMKNPTHFQHQ